MKLDAETIHAVIFDMDGVLVDSEYWWPKVKGNFFKSLMPHWNPKHEQKIIGRSLKEIHALLQREDALILPYEEFYRKYNQMSPKVYNKCHLMPWTKDVLQDLYTKIPLALASSSLKNWIDMVVTRFHLQKYFKVVVSGEEVLHSKPKPDIYLETAERLKIEPEFCLAIEDSTNGIASAKLAGMIVIGYKTPYNKEQDIRKADEVIEDLRDILICA